MTWRDTAGMKTTWAREHVFIFEGVDMFLRHITADENVSCES